MDAHTRVAWEKMKSHDQNRSLRGPCFSEALNGIKKRNSYTFSHHGRPREIVLARNCDDSVNFTVLIGNGPSLINHHKDVRVPLEHAQ